MTSSQLSPKGLFGGLAAELKLSAEELRNEFARQSALAVHRLVDVRDWRRGGAETFVSEGEMHLSTPGVIRVLGKAFVGWATPPVDQQRRWEHRRRQLAESGVPVPRVLATFPGLTVEQFIARELGPLAAVTEPEAFALGKIAAALQSLNLKPLSIHADIRVEDGILYYVDFGQDLVENSPDLGWSKQMRDAMALSARTSFEAGLENAAESD